jgi:hypothetical protein
MVDVGFLASSSSSSTPNADDTVGMTGWSFLAEGARENASDLLLPTLNEIGCDAVVVVVVSILLLLLVVLLPGLQRSWYGVRSSWLHKRLQMWWL